MGCRMDYENTQIAKIYDLANPWGPADDFYLSLAGERPLSVLDLGCGTGTLACALAERGHRVTGVDPAAAMLAVARSKPHAGKVEWIESRAQDYRSNRRFDLIVMTGHAFQVLHSDADALAVLENLRNHLQRCGRVAFETRNPRIDWAAHWDGHSRSIALPSGEELLENLTVTANEGEFISFRTSYRGSHSSVHTSSTLRFPTRQHVESLIARSGLLVRAVFGDWNAGSFIESSSREIIFIAQTPV